MVKHVLNPSCTTKTLEAKWAKDPLSMKGASTQYLSRYLDLDYCGGYVFFSGYKINNYQTYDTRYPEYGVITSSGTNEVLKHIQISGYSMGGGIHSLKVFENSSGDFDIFLAGQTNCDLEFKGATYPFAKRGSFLAYSTYTNSGSSILEQEFYPIRADVSVSLKVMNVVNTSTGSFDCSFGGTFQGNSFFTGSNTLDGYETNSPFWAQYSLDNLYSSPTASFEYAYNFGRIPSSSYVEINGITTHYNEDLNGISTYIFATFSGSVLIDEYTAITSAGGTDAFVAVYNEAGSIISYFHYSGEQDIEGGDIVSDESGNIYVAGRFKGSSTQKATLGDGRVYASSGGFDGFVDKFDAYLNHDWLNTVVLESSQDVNISDIEISNHADIVYFTGYHYDDLIINGTSGSSTIYKQAYSSTIAQSAYVGSLKVSDGANFGSYQLPTVNNSSGTTDAYGVKLDFHHVTDDISSGDYKIALLVNFDGQAVIDNSWQSKATDALVLRLNHSSSGIISLDGYTGFKGSGDQLGKYISYNNTPAYVSDDVPDLIVVVGYKSEIEYADGEDNYTKETAMSSNGDIFMGKYRPDNAKVWYRTFDIDNHTYPAKLAITGNRVTLFSIFKGTFTQSSQSVSSSSESVFYANYSYNDGSYVSSSLKSITSNGDISVNTIDLNQTPDIYLGGTFVDDITFSGFGTLTNSGFSTGSEVYYGVIDLCPNPPSSYSGSTTLTVCTDGVIDLNATLMGGGKYYWYEEDGSSGSPKHDPINTDFRECKVQVSSANNYWVQAVNDIGCTSSKVQIAFSATTATHSIVVAPGYSGSTLCGNGNGNSLELTHASTYPNYYSVTIQKYETVLGSNGTYYLDKATCYPTSGNCTFTVTSVGDYRLKIDEGCGEKYTSPITITSGFSTSISSNITNPIINCPDINEDVTLTASTGTGLSYQWYEGGNQLIGETSNILENVVSKYISSVTTYYFSCEITYTSSGGSPTTCTLRSDEKAVWMHPSLALKVNNSVTPPTSFSSSIFDLDIDCEKRYGGQAAQTGQKDAWFYYQGKEICHYQVISTNPLPYIFPVDYSDVIAEAKSQGNLPNLKDRPGTYFVRTFPNCAPSVMVYTNPVTMTLDCSSSAIPSGNTTITGNITSSTSYSSDQIYITTSIDVSAPLTFSDCLVTFSGDLNIKPGGSVTFTDCEVRMAGGTEIVVESGSTGAGSLYLTNTSATRPTYIEGCDLWKGITVQGDATSSSHRGLISIAGISGDLVEISNAEIAIYSEDGGLIEISHVAFSNNHNDIAFGGYGYTHNSYIENSTFYGTLLDKSNHRVPITTSGVSPYRFQFSPGTYDETDYGNMIYMEDVEGISLENNAFSAFDEAIIADILGGNPTSECIRGYGISNVIFFNNTWSGNHVRGGYFEDSDNLILSDSKAGGTLNSGFYFKDCSLVSLYQSSTTSKFDFAGNQGIKFESCMDLSVNNTTFDMNLGTSVSGLEFINSSEIEITYSTFGGTNNNVKQGVWAHGSSYSDLEISNCLFQELRDGVLIEDGNYISVSGNTFYDINTSGYDSKALQYYGTGSTGIQENTFSNNNYCIVASPVENPLTASGGGGTPANLSANAMDLTITCNRFDNSQNGIVGSGKFITDLGNATSGAENWFSDIVNTVAPQGLVNWDILWQSATISGTESVTYNFIGASCNLIYTPTGVGSSITNAGYTPNNSGSKNPITLNGSSISSNSLNMVDNCVPSPNPISASCYGSFKRGGTDITEVSRTNELEVNVFPNPTRENLKIESNYGISQIQILDVNQREIMQFNPKGQHLTQIPTFELSAGVYLLHIVTDQQTVIRQFVKL